MFRCTHCGEVQPPQVPAHRAVTAVRLVLFPVRFHIHPPSRQGRHASRSKWSTDYGGIGEQLVRTLSPLCQDCAEEIHGQLPEITEFPTRDALLRHFSYAGKVQARWWSHPSPGLHRLLHSRDILTAQYQAEKMRDILKEGKTLAEARRKCGVVGPPLRKAS